MTSRIQVRTKVKERLGIVDNDQRVPDSVINNFIQTVIYRLASSEDWWWLRGTASFSTIVNQRSYTLNADMLKLKVVYYQNLPLQARPPEQLVQYELMAGLPRYYYVSGENAISLYPVPSEVYNLNYLYYKNEIAIASDVDLFYTPDRFEDLIVAMVCGYVARRINDTEKENEFKTEVALWMGIARDSNVRSQGSFFPIRRTDWMNY